MNKTQSKPDRIPFDAPSMEGKGCAFAVEVKHARRVVGTLRLAKHNRFGRLEIAVAYLAPASWNHADHQAALRVAAHWARDIGNLDAIAKADLSHIIARLPGRKPDPRTRSESMMHAAINAYANSEWHKANLKWTTIRRFFDSRNEHLTKWSLEATIAEHQAADQTRRKAAAAERQAAIDARRAADQATTAAQARARAAEIKAASAAAHEKAIAQSQAAIAAAKAGESQDPAALFLALRAPVAGPDHPASRTLHHSDPTPLHGAADR
jgi:hypothetical protein